MRKLQILDSFWIRILAYFFMVCDHVGTIMEYYVVGHSGLALPVTILRSIGRLSFPLIVLLLVEGINHTHNEWKYLLRVGILTVSIWIPQLIAGHFITSAALDFSSPVNDIFFLCLMLVLLKQKGWKKIFSILPAAFLITTYVVYCVEMNGITVLWLPILLRTSYSIYGLLLALGFYVARFLASSLAKKVYGYTEQIENTEEFVGLTNAFQVAALIIINVFFLILYSYNAPIFLFIPEIQSWAMVAGIFILMYNGKLGYSKKWFRISNYLFFPVHLVLIFGIFYVILGLPGGF